MAADRWHCPVCGAMMGEFDFHGHGAAIFYAERVVDPEEIAHWGARIAEHVLDEDERAT